MQIHYLDNSATTPVCRAAADKAILMMTDIYGNPSSLHKMGIQAEAEVEAAREAIARSLSVEAQDIFFTSGGTEANNTAIFGAAQALSRRGRRVIVSAVEHPSVYESAARLKELGYEVLYAPVDAHGVIRLDTLQEMLNEQTVLVSVMAVNNETGSIQPTERIAKLIRRYSPEALFHVDAVQAYQKMPLKPRRWGVDLLTVSAHKIHGPKGVGALYLRRGARILPLLYGGEQQHKLRPGTESAPLIAAFGAAVQEAERATDTDRIRALHDTAVDKLVGIDGLCFNSPADALPYMINLSVPGIRSETMLHHLEKLGVYVSSSSACSKGKRSHVLTAMGLDNDRVDSSLRISLSRYNTVDDIDALCEGLKSGIATLQRR